MRALELEVLTMIKPIDGKGESTTSYQKVLINSDHVMGILEDPSTKGLVHLEMLNGSKKIAQGNLAKIKKLLK